MARDAMISRCLAALACTFLPAVLLCASCVQGSAPAPAPSVSGNLHPTDDGDPFGGDPDFGAGIGSEPPAGDFGAAPPSGGAADAPGGSSTGEPGTESSFSRLTLCLLLCRTRPEAKEAFCRSQPEPDVRARCFSKTRESCTSWTGWCNNEFGY